MQYKIDKKFVITLLLLPKVSRKNVFEMLLKLDRDINNLIDLIEYSALYGDAETILLLSAGDFETAYNKARHIVKESDAASINIITILDSAYPKLLGACDDPPIVLNYIGDITLLSIMPTICIAGTRKPSDFGKMYTYYAARFFAKHGFNIISGLARGCDTITHLGVIDANGVTCAVLAHGLDTIYPKENETLADKIKQSGVVVSEYFIGTPASKGNFVERNRIQAALSLGTLIIESGINSGSLHTANYAFSYERLLTCMKPPFGHSEETIVKGNMSLTRTGKAVGIYSESELEEFASAMKEMFK